MRMAFEVQNLNFNRQYASKTKRARWLFKWSFQKTLLAKVSRGLQLKSREFNLNSLTELAYIVADSWNLLIAILLFKSSICSYRFKQRLVQLSQSTEYSSFNREQNQGHRNTEFILVVLGSNLIFLFLNQKLESINICLIVCSQKGEKTRHSDAHTTVVICTVSLEGFQWKFHVERFSEVFTFLNIK